jgi:hypothetical protein
MTVTWNVYNVDDITLENGLSRVITGLHWYASDSETVGTGDDAITYRGHKYGIVSLADPDSSNYLEWEFITKEKAIEWAKDALGNTKVSEIESSIAAEILKSKTPTSSSGVPW